MISRRLLASIAAALSYFTILPVRGSSAVAPPDSGAVAALPLVGALLGALAGLGAWCVSLIAPQPLALATAFALLVILSGAIHIDGFLDCCDALFASVPAARRLEIIKDPRHGTFAVAAMAVVAVFWVAALATCAARALPAVLAFSAAQSRLAAVWNVQWFPYAPGGTASRALAAPLPWPWLALQTLILLAGSFAIGPWIWATVPASLLLGAGGARFVAARLGGGLVGDAYGFLIVSLEPLVIASVGVLQARA